MTTDIATLHAKLNANDLHFQIPSGYERWVRFGANWTMIISPYMILYFILVIVLGEVEMTQTTLPHYLNPRANHRFLISQLSFWMGCSTRWYLLPSRLSLQCYV